MALFKVGDMVVVVKERLQYGECTETDDSYIRRTPLRIAKVTSCGISPNYNLELNDSGLGWCVGFDDVVLYKPVKAIKSWKLSSK